jgi:hypothetical protein
LIRKYPYDALSIAAASTLGGWQPKTIDKNSKKGISLNNENIDINLNNYPNPFNPSTVIRYQLSVKSFTSLKIYDILGREMKTLVNENMEAGKYEIQFNASNLASGIYFYRLTVQPSDGSKAIVLNKSMQIIK